MLCVSSVFGGAVDEIAAELADIEEHGAVCRTMSSQNCEAENRRGARRSRRQAAPSRAPARGVVERQADVDPVVGLGPRRRH